MNFVSWALALVRKWEIAPGQKKKKKKTDPPTPPPPPQIELNLQPLDWSTIALLT